MRFFKLKLFILKYSVVLSLIYFDDNLFKLIYVGVMEGDSKRVWTIESGGVPPLPYKVKIGLF